MDFFRHHENSRFQNSNFKISRKKISRFKGPRISNFGLHLDNDSLGVIRNHCKLFYQPVQSSCCSRKHPDVLFLFIYFSQKLPYKCCAMIEHKFLLFLQKLDYFWNMLQKLWNEWILRDSWLVITIRNLYHVTFS